MINIDNEKHLITFDNLNIINCFTLKPYNFRDTQVSSDEQQEEYNKIMNDLNFKAKFIKPNQTHTNNVEIVTENNIDDKFLNTDGLLTNLKNVALVVSLADCQGILLYDKNKQVIGAVHSGWKGTLNKIVENAVNLMINKFNSNPENIEAYITPSILKCCFEVDKDVVDMFKEKYNNIDDLITLGDIKEEKQKYYIDTVEINKRVLLNLGLKNENIILSNICSKCNNNIIHSHRADGINSGRNIALICMTES